MTSSLPQITPVIFEQQSSVTSPRACVRITPPGAVFPLTYFDLKKNSHGATNSGMFRLAIAGMPDWTKILNSIAPIGATQQAPIYIEIYAGFPPNPQSWTPSVAGLSRRFRGVLDIYEPEDLKQTEFNIRSIAAPLTTDHITTAVQNLTTVQFIQQQGKYYNIPVKIDPSLTNPFTLARVYAQDFVVGLKNLIKWDVMLRSSIADDCDIWEDDGTLWYYRPWNVPRKTLKFIYGTNIESFKGHHAPQFNRSIRVQVHSYSQKYRTAVTTRVQSVIGGVSVSTVKKTSYATPQWGTNSGQMITYGDNGNTSYSQWSSGGGSTGSSNVAIAESGVELYNWYFPNLTYDECNNLTMAIWRQLSMHEYQGDFRVHVTPDILSYIGITMLLQLVGYTMTKFNTSYWPRTLSETFEGPDEASREGGGWYIESHAVNHAMPLGGGV